MSGTKVIRDVPASAASSSTAIATGAGPASSKDQAAITPEIVSVIESAVKTYAGRNIRVLSIKVAGESRPASNAWANQGRNIIHGSHNMVQRGH